MAEISSFGDRLKKLRRDRNLRQIDLANTLGVAQTTIANYEQGTRFPDEETIFRIADLFNVSLDYLFARTDIELNNEDMMYKDFCPLKEDDTFQNTILSSLQKEYLNYVLNGDKHIALQLVMDSVNSNIDVRDIYYHVFERSLKEVGRLWEMNIVDISQEHYFANVTQQLMSQLHPYFNARPRAGYSCVSLSVNGESHNIGVRMVTDFLEAEGWDTYYLGSDIPALNVIRTVQNRKADILLISATMAFNLDSVANLIEAVRSSKGLRSVKTMVGGRAFNIDKNLWTIVNADGYASTAEEAVCIAKQLAAEEI